MYVRVTTFEVDPSNVSRLSDKIAKIAPIAKSLPGVADIYVAWRGDGRRGGPRAMATHSRRVVA